MGCRRFAILISCGLACGVVGRAQADDGGPTREQCVQAYESSQLQRRNESLLAARKAFRTCASETCPPLARGDCLTWLSEIERTIPSVVFEAKADEGAVFDVRVKVDGAVVATTLDGKPVELDPGLHTFTFERSGEAALDEKVILREGEKNRAVVADWSTPKPAPPAPSASSASGAPSVVARSIRPMPAAAYVLGGVAVLGAADFVVAALVGSAKKSSLESSGCAPFCSADQVSSVRTAYVVADVGLAVSAAALVTGAIVFFTRPERPLPLASLGVIPFATGALVGCHVWF